MDDDKILNILTPLGLLGNEVCDKIILYLTKCNLNAIVLDGGKLHFVSVYKEGEDNA